MPTSKRDKDDNTFVCYILGCRVVVSVILEHFEVAMVFTFEIMLKIITT